MTRIQLTAIGLFVFTACSHRLDIRSELSAVEKKLKDNTGFMLYDPANRKTIYEYNAGHYFTPASNTKILTFYTALHILGDSIPGLRYTIRHDSIVVWGTGDPSLLYKNVYDNRRVYNFLQQSPLRLFVGTSSFVTEPWGPGWAWDDYPFAYSAERAPFPVYGNIEVIRKTANQLRIAPMLFTNHLVVGDSLPGNSKITREIDSNQSTYLPGKNEKSNKTWELPFHWSSDVLVDLLSDTLKRQVDEVEMMKPASAKTIYSVPADSLYAVMMKQSDNFIAEQLLMLSAEKISDTLDPDIALRYARKNFFADLPDELAWVDGSGLSRYNLTTPRNIVRIWEKLYAEVPKERLLKLLSVGGEKGTLKNYYASTPPFIFGKTGSLSNQQALSGYLITKKGKVLIFSFMNGNFIAPGKEIRAMMENILTRIRDNY